MGLINKTQQEYYNSNDFGGYQFITLEDVINNFTIAYVGEGKIISRIKRTDIAFHAQRGLQELSYDTLKSVQSLEIELPPSLTMVLPFDYVNYVKLTWSDSAGIEHVLYPTGKTSNPFAAQQGYDGDYTFNTDSQLAEQTGTTLTQSSQIFSNPGGPWSFSLLDNAGVIVTNPETLVSIGMAVTGLDVPLGTYITSFSGAAILINQPIPVGIYDLTITAANDTVEEITTDGTEVGILSNPNSNIVAGMTVTGPGVPQNTIVTLVSGVNITFNNVIPLGINVIFNYISNSPTSNTWDSYQSSTSSTTDDYEDNAYWPNMGSRYGLDPQYSQVNGSFFIDELKGKIHFSSGLSGKTIILKYISDGLNQKIVCGQRVCNEIESAVVHKFAEEALYKHIAYSILATRIGVPEQLIARFKKEKFALTRTAKLRLSNIKIEELTQVLRGKSKQIKH